ncbi:MAG: MFS transporter, partial [Candidatus Omnitrophica bacterium]|nr:MFS transporter [Candidatus Omnitrophota bacterium]
PGNKGSIWFKDSVELTKYPMKELSEKDPLEVEVISNGKTMIGSKHKVTKGTVVQVAGEWWILEWGANAKYRDPIIKSLVKPMHKDDKKIAQVTVNPNPALLKKLEGNPSAEVTTLKDGTVILKTEVVPGLPKSVTQNVVPKAFDQKQADQAIEDALKAVSDDADVDWNAVIANLETRIKELGDKGQDLLEKAREAALYRNNQLAAQYASAEAEKIAGLKDSWLSLRDMLRLQVLKAEKAGAKVPVPDLFNSLAINATNTLIAQIKDAESKTNAQILFAQGYMSVDFPTPADVQKAIDDGAGILAKLQGDEAALEAKIAAAQNGDISNLLPSVDEDNKANDYGNKLLADGAKAKAYWSDQLSKISPSNPGYAAIQEQLRLADQMINTGNQIIAQAQQNLALSNYDGKSDLANNKPYVSALNSILNIKDSDYQKSLDDLSARKTGDATEIARIDPDTTKPPDVNTNALLPTKADLKTWLDSEIKNLANLTGFKTQDYLAQQAALAAGTNNQFRKDFVAELIASNKSEIALTQQKIQVYNDLLAAVNNPNLNHDDYVAALRKYIALLKQDMSFVDSKLGLLSDAKSTPVFPVIDPVKLLKDRQQALLDQIAFVSQQRADLIAIQNLLVPDYKNFPFPDPNALRKAWNEKDGTDVKSITDEITYLGKVNPKLLTVEAYKDIQDLKVLDNRELTELRPLALQVADAMDALKNGTMTVDQVAELVKQMLAKQEELLSARLTIQEALLKLAKDGKFFSAKDTAFLRRKAKELRDVQTRVRDNNGAKVPMDTLGETMDSILTVAEAELAAYQDQKFFEGKVKEAGQNRAAAIENRDQLAAKRNAKLVLVFDEAVAKISADTELNPYERDAALTLLRDELRLRYAIAPKIMIDGKLIALSNIPNFEESVGLLTKWTPQGTTQIRTWNNAVVLDQNNSLSFLGGNLAAPYTGGPTGQLWAISINTLKGEWQNHFMGGVEQLSQFQQTGDALHPNKGVMATNNMIVLADQVGYRHVYSRDGEEVKAVYFSIMPSLGQEVGGDKATILGLASRLGVDVTTKDKWVLEVNLVNGAAQRNATLHLYDALTGLEVPGSARSVVFNAQDGITLFRTTWEHKFNEHVSAYVGPSVGTNGIQGVLGTHFKLDDKVFSFLKESINAGVELRAGVKNQSLSSQATYGRVTVSGSVSSNRDFSLGGKIRLPMEFNGYEPSFGGTVGMQGSQRRQELAFGLGTGADVIVPFSNNGHPGIGVRQSLIPYKLRVEKLKKELQSYGRPVSPDSVVFFHNLYPYISAQGPVNAERVLDIIGKIDPKDLKITLAAQSGARVFDAEDSRLAFLDYIDGYAVILGFDFQPIPVSNLNDYETIAPLATPLKKWTDEDKAAAKITESRKGYYWIKINSVPVEVSEEAQLLKAGSYSVNGKPYLLTNPAVFKNMLKGLDYAALHPPMDMKADFDVENLGTRKWEFYVKGNDLTSIQKKAGFLPEGVLAKKIADNQTGLRVVMVKDKDGQEIAKTEIVDGKTVNINRIVIEEQAKPRVFNKVIYKDTIAAVNTSNVLLVWPNQNAEWVDPAVLKDNPTWTTEEGVQRLALDARGNVVGRYEAVYTGINQFEFRILTKKQVENDYSQIIFPCEAGKEVTVQFILNSDVVKKEFFEDLRRALIRKIKLVTVKAGTDIEVKDDETTIPVIPVAPVKPVSQNPDQNNGTGLQGPTGEQGAMGPSGFPLEEENQPQTAGVGILLILEALLTWLSLKKNRIKTSLLIPLVVAVAALFPSVKAAEDKPSPKPVVTLETKTNESGRYVAVYGQGLVYWDKDNLKKNFESHALIVWNDGRTEFIPSKLIGGDKADKVIVAAIFKEAKEILTLGPEQVKDDVNGKWKSISLGFWEKMYEGNYVQVMTGDADFSRDHRLIIWKDQTAEWATLGQIEKDNGGPIYQRSKQILLKDKDGETVDYFRLVKTYDGKMTYRLLNDVKDLYLVQGKTEGNFRVSFENAKKADVYKFILSQNKKITLLRRSKEAMAYDIRRAQEKGLADIDFEDEVASIVFLDEDPSKAETLDMDTGKILDWMTGTFKASTKTQGTDIDLDGFKVRMIERRNKEGRFENVKGIIVGPKENKLIGEEYITAFVTKMSNGSPIAGEMFVGLVSEPHQDRRVYKMGEQYSVDFTKPVAAVKFKGHLKLFDQDFEIFERRSLDKDMFESAYLLTEDRKSIADIKLMPYGDVSVNVRDSHGTPELARTGFICFKGEKISSQFQIKEGSGLPNVSWKSYTETLKDQYSLAHVTMYAATEQGNKNPDDILGYGLEGSRGEFTFTSGKGIKRAAQIMYNGVTQSIAHKRYIGTADPLDLIQMYDPNKMDQPLFTNYAGNGDLVELNEVRFNDNHQLEVYGMTSGFETPRITIIDHETGKDKAIIFGFENHTIFPYRDGYTGNIDNRIYSNIFNHFNRQYVLHGEDPLFGKTIRESGKDKELTKLYFSEGQQKTINTMSFVPPALTQKLPVWTDEGVSISINAKEMVKAMTEGYVPLNGHEDRGLYQTNPSTIRSQYAFTADESKIIRALIAQGKFTEAARALKYYYTVTQGGDLEVYNSYNIASGEPQEFIPGFKRPLTARKTAAAQIALAQAAFDYAMATSDAQAMSLAKKIVNHLKTVHLVDLSKGGLKSERTGERFSFDGIIFWPDYEKFMTADNANAYLLFNQIARSSVGDSEFKKQAAELRDLQAKWLVTNILPRFNAENIVLSGTHELQDIQKTKATEKIYAQTLHVTAEDTLAFIRAAQTMGVAKPKLIKALDTASEMFGVTVEGVWGIDFTMPRGQIDTLSGQWTSEFANVAWQIGHDKAYAKAIKNLNSLYNKGTYPEVKTPQRSEELSERGLPTGVNNYALVEQTGESVWPISPVTAANVLENSQEAVVASPKPATLSEGIVLSKAKDMDSVIRWGVSSFAAVLGLQIFYWLAWALLWRRNLKNIQTRAGAQLVPNKVMAISEERWAKNILGATDVPGSTNQRHGDGPLSANFSAQLRALYKLVLAWRAKVNGYDEANLKAGLLGQDDPFLNGLDEFALMAGFFMRRANKEGYKDSKYSFDSNHFFGRLEMYVSPYREAMVKLLAQRLEAQDCATLQTVDTSIEELLKDMGMNPRQQAAISSTAALGFIQDVIQNNVRDSDMMAFNAITAGLGVTFKDVKDQKFKEIEGNTFEVVNRVMGTVMKEADGTAEAKIAHVKAFETKFKEFLKTEYSEVTPKYYLFIEAMKLLPQIVAVLGAMVVAYNDSVGGSSIIIFVQDFVGQLVHLLTFKIAAGLLGISILAHLVSAYVARARHNNSYLARDMRRGAFWNPIYYGNVGHVTRAIAFTVLGIAMLSLPVNSMSQYILTRGLVVFVIGLEVAAAILPFIFTAYSRVTQAWVIDASRHGAKPSRVLSTLNILNIPECRPMSILGDAFKYYLQPSVPTGSVWDLFLAVVNYVVLTVSFIWIGGVFIGKSGLSQWFFQQYSIGVPAWKMLAGGAIFALALYLARFAISNIITSVANAIVSWPFKVAGLLYTSLHFAYGLPMGWMIAGGFAVAALVEPHFLKGILYVQEKLMERRYQKNIAKHQAENNGQNKKFGVVCIGGDAIGTLGRLEAQAVIDRWYWFKYRSSQAVKTFVKAHQLQGLAGDKEAERLIKQLHYVEWLSKVTLVHPSQVVVNATKYNEIIEEVRANGVPLVNGVWDATDAQIKTVAGKLKKVDDKNLDIYVASEEQKSELLKAMQMRWFFISFQSAGGQSQDVGMTMVDIALAMAQRLVGVDVTFYFISNKYVDNNKRPSEESYGWSNDFGQRQKVLLIIEKLTRMKGKVIHDWTPFANKAEAGTGMDMAYESTPDLDNILIMDRNATVQDMGTFIYDVKTALANDHLVIVVPGRGTTNITNPMGQSSQLVEEGHRQYVKGVMAFGGKAGESVGTGWGNLLKNFYWKAQKALVTKRFPTRPMTSRASAQRTVWTDFIETILGLIGFIPHAVGISEDIWAVQQMADSSSALGGIPQFTTGRSMWHKIRESASHYDWMSAFPRWAGGFPQKKMDPMMQKVFDYGRMNFFAKEIRDNGGRFFLSAPLALLFIVVMPFAVKLGVMPFVGINLIFAALGILFNQVQTLSGLLAYLEAHGFNRYTAALSGAMAAYLTGNPAIAFIAFIAGGFALPFARWISTRPRDMIHFGTQLVIHVLGQIIRQPLVFVMSGALKMDAYSVDMREYVNKAYADFLSIKSVWRLGFVLFIADIIAISSLDMLNGLFLLPTLMFSVSLLLGPSVMKAKEGFHLGYLPQLAVRLAGWVSGFVFFGVLSFGVLKGGMLVYVSHAVLALTAVMFLLWFWKIKSPFSIFDQLMNKLRAKAGIQSMDGSVSKASLQGIQSIQGTILDFTNKKGIWEEASKKDVRLKGDADINEQEFRRIAQGDFDKVWLIVQKSLNTIPYAEGKAESRGTVKWFKMIRLYSEYLRHTVVSVFVLAFFYFVPIPGLLVFETEAARISVPLFSLLCVIGLGLGLVLVADMIFQSLSFFSVSAARNRFNSLYETYTQAESSIVASLVGGINETNRNNALTIAQTRALFADTLTYIEQGSSAYAHKTMNTIGKVLKDQQIVAPSRLGQGLVKGIVVLLLSGLLFAGGISRTQNILSMDDAQIVAVSGSSNKKDADSGVLDEMAKNAQAEGRSTPRAPPIVATTPATTSTAIPLPPPTAIAPQKTLKAFNDKTILGFNEKPFFGLSIDAQTFDATKIKNALGNANRTYFPMPLELVRQIVDTGKIKTLSLGIPLNQYAYGPENLNKFWGQAVPKGKDRISLEGNNYIEYIRAVREITNGKVTVIFELLNEPNFDWNYPQWVKKPATQATFLELYNLIDVHAKKIHKEIGPDVIVSTVLGDRPATIAKLKFFGIDSIRDTILDPNNKNGVWEAASQTEVRLKLNTDLKEEDVRKIAKGDFDKIWAILQQAPEHFVMAIKTDVNVVGVNYYRHNSSLMKDIKKAQESAGIYKPFYISEAGYHSKGNEKEQASIVLNDWKVFKEMGLSVFFMALEDNQCKGTGGSPEVCWGWMTEGGTPKQVYAQMQKIFAQEEAEDHPADAVDLPVERKVVPKTIDVNPAPKQDVTPKQETAPVNEAPVSNPALADPVSVFSIVEKYLSTWILTAAGLLVAVMIRLRLASKNSSLRRGYDDFKYAIWTLVVLMTVVAYLVSGSKKNPSPKNREGEVKPAKAMTSFMFNPLLIIGIFFALPSWVVLVAGGIGLLAVAFWLRAYLAQQTLNKQLAHKTYVYTKTPVVTSVINVELHLANSCLSHIVGEIQSALREIIPQDSRFVVMPLNRIHASLFVTKDLSALKTTSVSNEELTETIQALKTNVFQGIGPIVLRIREIRLSDHPIHGDGGVIVVLDPRHKEVIQTIDDRAEQRGYINPKEFVYCSVGYIKRGVTVRQFKKAKQRLEMLSGWVRNQEIIADEVSVALTLNHLGTNHMKRMKLTGKPGDAPISCFVRPTPFLVPGVIKKAYEGTIQNTKVIQLENGQVTLERNKVELSLDKEASLEKDIREFFKRIPYWQGVSHIVITTDLSKTQGAIAAVTPETRTMYLHFSVIDTFMKFNESRCF